MWRIGPHDQLTNYLSLEWEQVPSEASQPGLFGSLLQGCTGLLKSLLSLSCQKESRNQPGASLTLEPGGPTRPAAPGNPVAPCVRGREAVNPTGPLEAQDSDGSGSQRLLCQAARRASEGERARGVWPWVRKLQLPCLQLLQGLPRIRDPRGPLHTSGEGPSPLAVGWAQAGGKSNTEKGGVGSVPEQQRLGLLCEMGQSGGVGEAAAPTVPSTPPGGKGDMTHRRTLSTSGSFRTSHTSRTLGRKEGGTQ